VCELQHSLPFLEKYTTHLLSLAFANNGHSPALEPMGTMTANEKGDPELTAVSGQSRTRNPD
jgi:hypothetical protein